MGVEVAATKTPCTAQDVVCALVSIWRSELGSDTPSLETACVLAAQFALETGNGSLCIRWNLGNFKRPNPAAGDWCSFSTNEWVDGKEIVIHPPAIGCRFAVYDSLENGVRAWLRDLYTRWTLAWPGACEGNPEEFAAGLGAQKPPDFTAPVAQYAAGMRKYFDVFMRSIVLPDTEPTEPSC